MYIAILLRLILGYVIVEVEGYYIERFINICQNKKILIWNIKREKGVKLFFNIGIKDFRKLKQIARKTNCKLKIRKKRGIPFFMHKYKKRKVFIIFLLIISIFIYTSSRYIWNIEINVEEKQVIENIEKDLYDLGLKKGILKNKIDTGKIINEIRLKRSDISWMGLDIKGTNAVVRIIKADEKPKLLIKPQFEAGRSALNKNGIVNDMKDHIRVLNELAADFQTKGMYIVWEKFRQKLHIAKVKKSI